MTNTHCGDREVVMLVENNKVVGDVCPLDGGEIAEKHIIGKCDGMRDLIANVHKMSSAADVPVLICGESGTGKELVARVLHESSPRRNGPFVAVNCGALPTTLIQAELFGYEKGAFTGAHHRSIGRLEAAASGTVFLDEIGDIPLDLQVNLLRFIQERTIERLGSRETIHVDTRITAATHRDLARAVERGEFREDLYYRLNVLELKLPPLRERGSDIRLLAEHYLQLFGRERTGEVLGFTQQALDWMATYAWPGNIRELVNRVHRAVIMFDDPWISAQDLGFGGSVSEKPTSSLARAKLEAEKQAIICSLTNCHGNVSAAARQLAITRTTLYRLMEKHALGQHPPTGQVPSGELGA
jgi:DNA-binding NtrC family response regulator